MASATSCSGSSSRSAGAPSFGVDGSSVFVGGTGEGREVAAVGWAIDVSDCPRMSASASRGGGEWTRGGTRGTGGGDGGGVEPRDALGWLPILFAGSGGGSGSDGGRSEKVSEMGDPLIGCSNAFVLG